MKVSEPKVPAWYLCARHKYGHNTVALPVGVRVFVASGSGVWALGHFH